MDSVYILKLIDNKYYIGRSSNPYERIQQHFDGCGSMWTKKYQPIDIIEIIENCNNFDEDKYTIQYMANYGIENVRGGAFVQIKLSINEINVLQKMINNALNKCFICGEFGHFASNCKKNILSHLTMTYQMPIQTSYLAASINQPNLMNQMNQSNSMNQSSSMNQMNQSNSMNRMDQSNSMNQMNQINQPNSMNQMNQINSMNQMDQSNSMNQMNQMNQPNSMNQMNQPNSMNQMNQMNQPNSMNQMNQPNSMDQMNKNINEVIKFFDQFFMKIFN